MEVRILDTINKLHTTVSLEALREKPIIIRKMVRCQDVPEPWESRWRIGIPTDNQLGVTNE